MLLSEYHSELVGIIGRYAQTDLIIASTLTIDARTPKMGAIKGTLDFVDGMRLFFTEYVDTRYRLEKLTYPYHCQDVDSRLLFRYDNAVHKPALTYVCHKHLSSGDIVEADPPDLADILDEALEQFAL